MAVKRKTKTTDSHTDLYRIREERWYTTTYQANSVLTEKKILHFKLLTDDGRNLTIFFLGIDVGFRNTALHSRNKLSS